MVTTSNLNKLLKKLAKPADKVPYRRVKVHWRRKTRAPIKLSTADRVAMSAKRAQARNDVEQDLLAARQGNWETAEQMAEKHGHKAAYWYKQIIYDGQTKLTEKGIEPWNVYVNQELKKANDGAFFFRARARARSGITQREAKNCRASRSLPPA